MESALARPAKQVHIGNQASLIISHSSYTYASLSALRLSFPLGRGTTRASRFDWHTCEPKVDVAWMLIALISLGSIDNFSTCPRISRIPRWPSSSCSSTFLLSFPAAFDVSTEQTKPAPTPDELSEIQLESVNSIDSFLAKQLARLPSGASTSTNTPQMP